MIEFTYDSCLLFIKQINQSKPSNDFEVIEMQTDDILMLGDNQFADLKENELAKAKLTFKNREMLTTLISIKFNDRVIIIDSSGILLLNQLKQFDQIRLINVSVSIDLISSRGQIRKSVTLKDQYVAQRTRDAYIVTMSQSEAIFDLSVAAQVTNSKEENAKRLNQRLQ